MAKEPKYQQIANVLRREIEDGVLEPGADLPSESELMSRFSYLGDGKSISRNTVRAGTRLLVEQGLVDMSQGRTGVVRKVEIFELNASRFENLTFPQQGDAYNTDVKTAGRRPHQFFRVELQRASEYVAQRLKIDQDSRTVMRFCHRFVDDVPWSTQATHYPDWLVQEAPRLGDPGDIEEGTTRYLADHGIEQIGYFDEIATRMPNPEEVRLLELSKGTPVLLWTRTGYTVDRPIRCTVTTMRGDLNRMNYELGDLSARGETE
jgi:GntR family transcriptional regulator